MKTTELAAAVIVLCICSEVAVAAQPPVDLKMPGIPVSYTDPPKTQRVASTTSEKYEEQQKAETPGQKPRTNQAPLDLLITPGSTELVEIAAGFLNRIVTPFPKPKIVTANDIKTEVDGSVIYVATDSKKPVGLYIADESGNAISLTLIPQSIPPREVRVRYRDRDMQAPRQNPVARRWEESSAYEETLVLLLREVANGRVPPGYTLSDGTQISGAGYSCFQNNLKTEIAQILEGHNLRVIVLRAESTASETFEIRDSSCYRRGIVAVAPWPNAVLYPTETTEIYLVENKNDPLISESSEDPNKRPSVVGAR